MTNAYQAFRRFTLSGILGLALVALASCSDTTTSPDPATGNIRIEAATTTSTVPFGKGAAVSEENGIQQGATVDSLRITGLKLMVSEIKLFRSGGGEEKVKTGPALLTIDQTGARAVITGTVPTGTFNKINFKFHRLNDQEVLPFAGNADFADFITGDRHTIIVEGIAYDKGQSFPFRYGSKVEEDLKFDMADFGTTQNGVTVIVLQLDPVAVFKDKDTRQVMDPRDTENANRIDDAIKAALNALRK
jgi:hypothetical protein